jgi:uncharacterized membrane protein
LVYEIIGVRYLRGKGNEHHLSDAFQRAIYITLVLVMVLSSVPFTMAEGHDDIQMVQKASPPLIDRPFEMKTPTPSSKLQTDFYENFPFTLNQEPRIFIKIKNARFDPLIQLPDIARGLTYTSSPGYYLVQCQGPIRSKWHKEIQNQGASILGYIPDYTYLVKMDEEALHRVSNIPFIRWIGIYHPAYKLQTGLLEIEGEVTLDVIVFKDSKENVVLVREELRGLDGEILYDGKENNIITTKIMASQIRDIAFIPQVEWINLYTEPISHMNKVRGFTGADYILLDGYDGTGIVGEVKDNGIDQDHPDFVGQLIATDGNPPDGDHGTCCFGIVFGSGANDADATGMLPGGEGVFSYWTVSRTNSINNLVNNWGGLFQSNSWSQGNLDSSYSSYSREDDQIVYDYDVVMLYAAGNSNQGVGSETLTQDAVAKNIISVGAVSHFDDENRDNHFWVNWGAGSTPSQGPAEDGRIKPDLAGVFDWIYTTDSPDGDGEDGYASGDYYSNFGGTSGATPIAAGATGLVYQMYMADHFGNNPSMLTPHAATVKAILIADAYQYDFSQATRYQQGWGLVDVQNVYDVGKNHFIVDQEVNIQTGERVNYSVTPTVDDPMKISLVWTDVPALAGADPALINNLDLKVIDPVGNIYWGNYGLDNSKWSLSGGTADTLNNVENIFVENPSPGEWTIEIIGENIPLDGNISTPQIDQHFALVASNILQQGHDLGISDLMVDNYVVPNAQTSVTANIYNNGLSEENDILVNFTVDSVVLDTTIIPSLEVGNSVPVYFDWTPSNGIYLVGIEVVILPGENFTTNNFQEKVVIAEPDISVLDMDAPKFSRPSQVVSVNSTIMNLGKVDLSNVDVQLLINGTVEDSTVISSLPSDSSANVSFTWTPLLEGWFEIEVYALPHVDESLILDNRLNSSILITSQDPLKVVILDSWGTDFAEDAPWDYITSNWVEFGSIPVSVDYTSLNKDDITYSDIESTNADVLLISCPYFWEFTDAEINAISDYVRGGKGLVGTSATFLDTVPNNNKLAFLFGMRDDLSYDADFTPILNLTQPAHPLFINVPDPYQTGSEVTILPPDFSWDASDIINGTYVAKSEDDMGAIITHKGVVYISHWIEYQSNRDDMQLLYNAMIWSLWQRDEHDLSVSDIQVQRYVDLGEQVDVSAKISNLGLSDEVGVKISFYVDDVLEDQITIPSLTSDDSQIINFVWNAPNVEDIYNLKIEAASHPSENFTENNAARTSAIVSDGPSIETIGLISDSSQLNTITSILDDLSKTYDALDDNSQNLYTADIMLLLHYETVIFYNQNRLIDIGENQALNDYIELGGKLIVTGFDSIGSPDDTLLADVVRSTDVGDNMGESSFSVIDDMHPITNGIFGQFSTGISYNVGQTDHDNAQADASRSAQTICELNDGFDKIIVTEEPAGGKVIYWNGNRFCDDWTAAQTTDMFKNMIVWLMPIYDDVALEAITVPSIFYVNETVDITATVINLGLNDTGSFWIDIRISNSFGPTILWDVMFAGSLSHLQREDHTWQWSTHLSGTYTIRMNVIKSQDEIQGNNELTKVVTVYFKYFEDEMEDGEGDWTSSASSLSPLWHQTTSESYSPLTSWWCGTDSATQYSVLAEQYLTSEVLDLTDANTAFLTFYHRYSIDDYPMGGDWGLVEINSGGSGWTQIDSYSQLFLDWTQVTIDISSFVGDTVQIRFHLRTGVLLTDNGWWVDDFLLHGIKNQYGVKLSVSVDTASAGFSEFAYYDITVENTGNVYNDFTFDISGGVTDNWFVDFNPQTIAVMPGLPEFVNLSIIPNDTPSGNINFQMLGYSQDGGVNKAQDALDLYIDVKPWNGIDIDIPSDQLYLIPGESNDIIITIINEGNEFDTFTLDTESYEVGVSSSWIYQLEDTSVGLDAFQSVDVGLTIYAPEDGVSGDHLVVNVTGTSQNDPDHYKIGSTTTTIIDFYGIHLSTAETEKGIEPGSSVDYYFDVTNLGNTPVTIEMDVSPIGNWNGWSGIFNTNDFLADAFTTYNVTLSISSPSGLLENEYKEFQVGASTIYNQSIVNINTSVSRTGSLNVNVDDDTKSAKNGDWMYFHFTVTSTQNAQDTIDVRASSLNGWQVGLFKWDEKTTLEDTDSDGKKDTGLLEAWDDSEEVVVGILVPQDALVSDSDTMTVTFTSSLVNGMSVPIEIIAEAAPSGGIILTAVSHSESATSGEQINYWITVVNNFNYATEIDLTLTSQENWPMELLVGDGSDTLGDSNLNGLPDTGSLEAFGGTADLMVLLTVPQTALAFRTNLLTLKATSSDYDGGLTTMWLNATVSRIYDFEIDIVDQKDYIVTAGGDVEFTISISNDGNFQEDVNLRFSELPFGWRGYFSNREPSVSIGESQIVTVTLEIPSDAEVGSYIIYITGSSSDDVESVDVSASVEIEKKEEGPGLMFYLLLIMIIVVVIIIVALVAARSKGKKAAASSRGYDPQAPPMVTAKYPAKAPMQQHYPAKGGYEGPIFPSFETIRCPTCFTAFDVEVGGRPTRVICPNCGASGTIN